MLFLLQATIWTLTGPEESCSLRPDDTCNDDHDDINDDTNDVDDTDLTTHVLIPELSHLADSVVLWWSKEGMTRIFSKIIGSQFVSLVIENFNLVVIKVIQFCGYYSIEEELNYILWSTEL